MPPVLHPRSRTTLSLFTTTLALSFAVVGLPHLLPCPAPRKGRVFADGEMPGPRVRQGKATEDSTQTTKTNSGQNSTHTVARECPVPKPSGMVARIFGVQQSDSNAAPVVVQVQQHVSRPLNMSKSEKSSGKS